MVRASKVVLRGRLVLLGLGRRRRGRAGGELEEAKALTAETDEEGDPKHAPHVQRHPKSPALFELQLLTRRERVSWRTGKALRG